MMSRKSRTTLSTVEKLIEQRRLFQDWLTKLHGEVDGMPGHVVERVRNDYRARLDGVMAELGEHRDALREALDEAQERFDGLDTQQQARKDELAELKLRRHVGEMDEIRFKEQSGTLKAALDAVLKDLGVAQKDIERFEEILGVIATDDAPKQPEPPPPPPVRQPVAAAPVVDEDDDDEEEEEEEEEYEDEEEPVAVKPASAPPRTEARREEPKPAPPPAPAPAAPRPGVDELAFLRSVAPPGSKAPVPAPDQRTAARGAPPAPQRPSAPATEPAKRAEAAASVNEEFSASPGLLHLPPSEHDEPEPAAVAAPVKKDKDAALVCGECGATNRPTEWYCEKCGAELAAY